MGKRDGHRQDLIRLFDELDASGDSGTLTAYLVSNSNLPGPRGNLELAQAFGDVAGERSGQGATLESLWKLCVELKGISATEAPVNDPREILPFCGAVGLGAIAATRVSYTGPAMRFLRDLARDPRWRTREAVCFALQRLMTARSDDVVAALNEWVAGGHPLELRAVAASVAEPALLRDGDMARSALALHRGILVQMLEMDDRRSDAFRSLRKGLGYSLSVVVCALPQEGFGYLAELAGTGDRDVHWILRQNLKKNRLIKNYPAEVSRLQASL
jgi:hypothetical protein